MIEKFFLLKSSLLLFASNHNPNVDIKVSTPSDPTLKILNK